MDHKKVQSKAFEEILTDDLKLLFSIFKEHGYELRIAGGAVRDLLMGRVPEDIDLATTATPDQMKEMMKQAHVRTINANGEKHGTVTVRINDRVNFEVTTLRIDLVTNGRHAEVQFTDDWRLDASRRDLTINSIFLEEDGTVIDYFNGYEDMQNHRVRFVGEADRRIKEDYLRILRYFRLYSRICTDDHSHDTSALEAIKANADGLTGIAGERIWMELRRIVCSEYADSLLTKMQETGVFKYIGLPEVCNLAEFSRVYRNFHDEMQHIPSPITMICALLNTNEEFEVLNKRLRFSNEEKKLAEMILKHRDLFKSDDNSISNSDSPQTIKRLRNNTREEQIKALKLIMVENSKDSKEKAKMRIVELLKYMNRRDLIADVEQWPIPDFPIRGDVLIERNLPKGPVYSKILEALKKQWAHEFDLDTGEKTVEKLIASCDEMLKQYTNVI